MRFLRYLRGVLSEIAVWWGRFWPGVWTVRGWLPLRPAWIGLLVVVIMGTAIAWPTAAPLHPVSVALEEPEMQVKVDTWKWKPANGGGCLTHTVTTTQQQGESQEAFTARHDAAVRADLVLYPPVAESECS